MCWGTPVCASERASVRACVRACAAVLSHFRARFLHSSLGRTPPAVQGLFCVLVCDHLVPHHCRVEDRPGIDTWIAIKPLNVSAQPREAKGDNGDVTNPFRTICTCPYMKPSCRRLLGCQHATVNSAQKTVLFVNMIM